MENSYWKGRWERGEIGWHQQEVEPALVSFFSKISPTQVFVPLCGKSKDLIWLASQGHEVIGVELSELACQSFFIENYLSYKVTHCGSFILYQSEKISIYNGDFFTMDNIELPDFGAIYDRAALIALPPEMRIHYSAHLCKLTQNLTNFGSLSFLQIVVERTSQENKGPPFSVPLPELQKLYGAHFEIILISREKVDLGSAPSEPVFECVYCLKLK